MNTSGNNTKTKRRAGRSINAVSCSVPVTSRSTAVAPGTSTKTSTLLIIVLFRDIYAIKHWVPSSESRFKLIRSIVMNKNQRAPALVFVSWRESPSTMTSQLVYKAQINSAASLQRWWHPRTCRCGSLQDACSNNITGVCGTESWTPRRQHINFFHKCRITKSPLIINAWETKLDHQNLGKDVTIDIMHCSSHGR